MKLIKLQDKFILVSNEVIKEGDYFWNPATKEVLFASKEMISWNNNTTQQHKGWLKIIAGIPELFTITKIENDYNANVQHIKSLPSIDFSLLKEEDCKTIGYVDIEELADSSVSKVLLEEGRYWNDQDAREPVYYGIIEGFKTAQALNDKMFSLEDIEKAMIEGLTIEKFWEKCIQSLQQTSWEVKVKMETVKDFDNHGTGEVFHNNMKEQPKITNNSIKVLRIL